MHMLIVDVKYVIMNGLHQLHIYLVNTPTGCKECGRKRTNKSSTYSKEEVR